MSKDILDMAYAKLADVYRQREKILEAFIAETGMMPSECEQVYQTTPEGVKWRVRKRGDDA